MTTFLIDFVLKMIVVTVIVSLLLCRLHFVVSFTHV